ncbi:MAG: L-rhamnose mutarotase [Bacteroidota bacterium]
MPTTETLNTGYTQQAFDKPVKRYCMHLELKDDPTLIQEYKEWHSRVWPEVLDGIKKVGILDHEIYIDGTHLFMVLVAPQDFDFETQMGKLAGLPRQAEWEEFMTKYQKSSPDASSAEKWVKMERIFKFTPGK